MGLDATWYAGLKKRDDVVFDGEGEPTNVADYFRPRANPDFDGRDAGLVDRAVYEYAEFGRAWSGGYSYYNAWREQLAKMAGYPLTDMQEFDRIVQRHAAACWNGATGPFSELINFSDCDGVIGPIVAKKLAADFGNFQGEAESIGGDFLDRYNQWRFAFERAAEDGAIDFH